MTSDAQRLRGAADSFEQSSRSVALRLNHLRWLATVIPAGAVFGYETVRHQLLNHQHDGTEIYGNLLTGGVALVLSFLFARMIFRSVENIQMEAVEETRTSAALNSMIEERERLSRELHDGLAQVISYVLVRLDTVRNLVEDDKRDFAIAELESLRSTVDNVNIDVRESIAGLRSRVVERGLSEALSDYLEEYEERYGIRTELRLAGPRPDISPNAALQLFRVVQEALTNVRKHAGANQVRVGVDSTVQDVLEVVIADNGHGFDVAEASSNPRAFGLMSMRERTNLLGGECRLASARGRGTTVTISVPAGGQG